MAKASAWAVAVGIARRDLLDLWRAKMLLFFFILMPLLLMTMFGFIYPPVPKSNPSTGNIGTAFSNLPVALVQMDDGQTANSVAAQFIQISAQQGLFKISEIASYPAARDQIVEGNIKGIIIIPQSFSDAIAAVRRALWSAPGFSMSRHRADSVKIPTALMERLTDALCYAA